MLRTASITLILKNLIADKIHSNEDAIARIDPLKDGHFLTQIAKFFMVSRMSVNKWVQTFLEEGREER